MPLSGWDGWAPRGAADGMWLVVLMGLFVCTVATQPAQSHTKAPTRDPTKNPSIAQKDEIKSLPGWSDQLPTAIFSGLLSLDGGARQVHYFLVHSEGNVKTDPLLVWMNGGPGASSMYGALAEIGAFRLTSKSLNTSDGVPTLFKNDFGWQQRTSILVFDSPPPVGYSTCSPCPRWNDTSAGRENYDALQAFLQRHDYYRTQENEVFIAGESYAGVYVPELVNEIITQGKVNLKGFAMGDACMGIDWAGTERWCPDCVCPVPVYYQVEFMHGHGQCSSQTYRKIISTCGETSLRSGNWSKISGCRATLDQMKKEVGGFNAYNVYDECEAIGQPVTATTKRATRIRQANDPYQCGAYAALDQYCNNSKVKRALHVPTTTDFVDGDDDTSFYQPTVKDLRSWYKKVVTSTPLRILIYNGDTDTGASVPAAFAEDWTRGLGLKEKEAWRPWTIDGAQLVGGHVTRYEGDFDFLTVRGSGHMVPLMKPASALEMISKWLNNEPWKPYVHKGDDDDLY